MKEKCSKEKGKMEALGKRCLRSEKKYGIIEKHWQMCHNEQEYNVENP